MAEARRMPLKLAGPLAACALLATPGGALAAGTPGTGTAGTGTAGGSGLSGGAGLTGPAGPGTASANPLVQPAEQQVSASGNGITVETLASGETSQAVTFSGTVASTNVGRTVQIERASGRGPELKWSLVAVATVASGGTFSAVWHANRSGRFELEAVLEGSSQTATSDATAGSPATSAGGPSSSGTTPGSGAVSPSGPAPGTATSSPPLTIDIYQPALATLYGPGFYGQKTACGITLHRSTLGVANRTLACGTRVELLYGGQRMLVLVIDRGPYANGAAWDLTAATARALGMLGTATIGALPLRHP